MKTIIGILAIIVIVFVMLCVMDCAFWMMSQASTLLFLVGILVLVADILFPIWGLIKLINKTKIK